MALLERVDKRRGTDPASDPASAWLARDAAFREELDDPASFDAFVVGLASITRDLDPDAVAGVSTTGRRLAYAVARKANIAYWKGEAGPRSLLLVDGLVNTGVQLILALRSASEAGVEVVAGAAVRAERAAIVRLLETGAEVRALQLV